MTLENKFEKAEKLISKLNKYSVLSRKHWKLNKKLNLLVADICNNLEGETIETMKYSFSDEGFEYLLPPRKANFFSELRKEGEKTWRLIYLEHEMPRWKILTKRTLDKIIDERRLTTHYRTKEYINN